MDSRLIDALTTGDESRRLKAALALGSTPDPAALDTLLERCAVEPDFFVRDMLTWALTRLPSSLTVPRLIQELQSTRAQARSQALHTLSKIKDPVAWNAITRSLLRDADDEVARSAWRAAVILVPDDKKEELARELAELLGRGDRDIQLSLSRALICLGEDVVTPVIKAASASDRADVRAHAAAVAHLLLDPQTESQAAVEKAKRIFALGKE